jgi:hypothetical protein
MKQVIFEFENTSNSLVSAKYIIDEIFQYFESSTSFIDYGCGLGAWASVFESKGIQKFKCFDHPTLPKEKLLIQNKENFFPMDLEYELPEISKVDFCICIEVLEHFSDTKGRDIINFLTSSSDLILFSAAIPNQKGVGHINEQRHNYWHNIFQSKGFMFYDGFKSELFKHENEIKFFHLQNMFIYYNDSNKHLFLGHHNVSSQRFELVARDIIEKPLGISDLFKELPKAFIRNIKLRIK